MNGVKSLEPRTELLDVDLAHDSDGAGRRAEGVVQRRRSVGPVERPWAWRPRQLVRRAMAKLLPRRLFVVCGSPHSGKVYFTFDDGPDPEHTPRVLDALKANDVKATFFVTGKQCLLYPDLVRRILDGGHCVGHHSFSHSEPAHTSARRLIDEIRETDDALLRASDGLASKYFRPPHGKLTAAKLWRLWLEGHTVVLWNRDSKDYQAKSAEQLREWVCENPLESGDVVLMHDTNPHTAEALPSIIEVTRNRGLYPETIADLTSPATKGLTSAAHNIVCFAKDWEECPTSNNHVMQELAKTHRVLWLNSIATRTPRLSNRRDVKKIFTKLRGFLAGPKRIGENMWVYTPLVLPMPHSNFAKKVNERILRFTLRWLRHKLGMNAFQLWTFLPNAADYVGKLGEALVVYYCVDDWSKFNYLDGQRIAEEERRLVRSADLVFASAQTLVNNHRPLNAETHLARHGVDHALFAAAFDAKTPVPADIASLSRPILGFFGTVQDWIDFRLIRYLAERHPEWSIVFIGPVLTDVSVLSGLANVHLLGRKPHATLPNYCKAFSVGIIPYVVNDRIAHVNPLKMREYLSAGLPVVSVKLPEVQEYRRFCAITETSEQFEQAVVHALTTDSLESRRERSEVMRGETWEQATAQLAMRVYHALERKGSTR
jgi:peptidoglycan/xylan/chitin deacetylase (PgdA/CDA1 family)